MFQLAASYAAPDDPESFVAHYRATHAPLVRALPNVRSFTWAVSESLDDRAPAHFVIATIRWDSRHDALAALASPEGQATVADLTNFAGAGVDIELGECTVEV